MISRELATVRFYEDVGEELYNAWADARNRWAYHAFTAHEGCSPDCEERQSLLEARNKADEAYVAFDKRWEATEERLRRESPAWMAAYDDPIFEGYPAEFVPA